MSNETRSSSTIPINPVDIFRIFHTLKRQLQKRVAFLLLMTPAANRALLGQSIKARDVGYVIGTNLNCSKPLGRRSHRARQSRPASRSARRRAGCERGC